MSKRKRHASTKQTEGQSSNSIDSNNTDDYTLPELQQYGDNDTNYTTRTKLEIRALTERIERESPSRGTAPPLTQRVTFRSLPISNATLNGLISVTTSATATNSKKRAHTADTKSQSSPLPKFTHMTAIQNACIPHALAGRDILGAAKTGSGKTLAFLLPLIETLFRNEWTHDTFGTGAIVLSPTRELSMQIFTVLRSIGRHHDFSAALLVGGKKEFRAEQARVPTTHILIATPGRLLQHLEQTPNLDVSELKVLVLDEADRILDLGFQVQLNRILEYLPQHPTRQTMLFSATQTRRVKDLASLSLHQPEYLGVHDASTSKTPASLEQNVLTCPLPHKLNMLYSFLKSHLKHKIMVFFSTCSQVRFVYELFCALQPGTPILSLHGRIHQDRRTSIYFDYTQRPHAVLLATDLASRGLDFPNVDWVIQVDAPEDAELYIHRVGRTARNCVAGKSLLLVTPREKESVLGMLSDANIISDDKASEKYLKPLHMNPKRAVSVTSKANSILASRSDLNALGKKAFASYLRSLCLLPNRRLYLQPFTPPQNTHPHNKALNKAAANAEITAQTMPLDEFAKSYGLASTPSTRFFQKAVASVEDHPETLDRGRVREKKNKNFKLERLKEQIRMEKLKKRIAAIPVDSQAVTKAPEKETMDAEEADLLVVKQTHEWKPTEEDEDDILIQPTRKTKKIRIEGGSSTNTKIKFDDDGNAKPSLLTAAPVTGTHTTEEVETAHADYLETVRNRLAATKDLDKKEETARIKDKHTKRRLEKKGALEEKEEGAGVTLDDSTASSSSGSDSSGSDDSGDDSDSDSSDSDNDSSDSDNESNDDTSDDDNVQDQEELALSMLRNK